MTKLNYMTKPLSEGEYSDEDRHFMQMAIDCSVKNVAEGGGPFGAVIVREGEVLSVGVNRVTANSDPTAHAEVMAIREACRKAGNFKLPGATIYSSCEPCPMCLSAIYWAGISKVCYANTKDDAATVGFDDSFIYEQLAIDYEHRSIPMRHFMRAQAQKAFRLWNSSSSKIEY